MGVVDYDQVAPVYDQRYELQRYEGILACLEHFLSPAAGAVLEVGCGTGQWLAELGSIGGKLLAGVDLSQGMLSQARLRAPAAALARATASLLPIATATFDRVFCVNALHHFPDHAAFFHEAHRVLKPGGGLISIGLDPHHGGDTWWVYDYFPGARRADETRYPPTAAIRSGLAAAGFISVQTSLAQHISGEAEFAVARAQGLLDRRATSQLMVISDAEYASGLQRLEAERPTLRGDLRLYASSGWKGTGSAV